jgi:hypothetical protein
MKKTYENVGVQGTEPKIDYFKLRKETPLHLRKRMTLKEFYEKTHRVREEKQQQSSLSSELEALEQKNEVRR